MVIDITLKRKEVIAHDTLAFYFEKPDGFIYRAGQFADRYLINADLQDTRENVHAFSFITSPFQNEIGFATRLRTSLYKKILSSLQIGDHMQIDGPRGDFKLHNNISKPAVFIIGGIGITPVISMIRQATHDLSDQPLLLFYANKTLHDAPFEKELKELSQKNRNFTLIQILSRQSDSSYEHGHITSQLLEKYIDTLNECNFYLAGPQAMVKAMRSLLEELTIDEDSISVEEFDGY